MINKNINLIYDVGMHRGTDTEYYLKKGFKVVAFEADPDLINFVKQKFKNEIKNEQLIIVEGAIVDKSTIKKGQSSIKFYKNKDNDVWGTIFKSWAERNENFGTSNEIIEVPIINFEECIIKYGIPYYLKIDIEGADLVCLKSLLNFKEKPSYISIESEKRSFKALKEEFNILKKLGYFKFKAINQEDIEKQKEPKNSTEGIFLDYSFIYGSTGLFGSDLPGNWKSRLKILLQYRKIFLFYKLFGDFGILNNYAFGTKILRFINKHSKSTIPGWYDTHAKHCSVNKK